MYKHMVFQMTFLLQGFVTHSLHMHGFYPARLSYMAQTCDITNLTVLHCHVASEYEQADDISERMTIYTRHR